MFRRLFPFILLFSAQAGAQIPCTPIQLNDITTCKPGNFQLNASTLGYSTYTWSPSNGLNSTTIPNPIATVTGTITYTVIASGIGPNLVVNPDFSQGNTGSSSAYFHSSTDAPGNYFVATDWFGGTSGLFGAMP